jgi:hypothetical protein
MTTNNKNDHIEAVLHLASLRLSRVYTPVVFEQKASADSYHVNDVYYGAGSSLYGAA